VSSLLNDRGRRGIRRDRKAIAKLARWGMKCDAAKPGRHTACTLPAP